MAERYPLRLWVNDEEHRLEVPAHRLLIDVLQQIGRGESAGVPVDMSEASYFSFPKREHVAEFRQRGHRLI